MFQNMIAEYLPENSQAAIMLSIKNGAWFESTDERGFTHLAEYCMQRLIIDACNTAGIDSTTFIVRGDTGADRVRFTVFCLSKDVEKIAEIIRVNVEQPNFTRYSIREEMRLLRRDYIDSFRNPYFRAQCAVAFMYTKKNPSVFGSALFHIFARGPNAEALFAYWKKFWETSARDVLVFGADTTEAAVQVLSRDIPVPLKSFSVQDHTVVATRRFHGVFWREECASPLYTLLVRVMGDRADAAERGTNVLIADRGEWRMQIIIGGSSKSEKWNTIFAKDVTQEEWTAAKEDFAECMKNILTGYDLEDDTSNWDDCTPAVYGQFGIASLQELVDYVEKSTFEEFKKYWSATIKTA